jgi:hypothetical protein
MNLVYAMLYFYLLLRPYYFFDSGGLQISDYFLILAFLMLVLVNKNRKVDIFKELKENKEFYIFTLLILFVNLFYFLVYFNFKFILSTSYYIFISIALILFSYSFRHNKKFLINMEKIFKLNLIIQLVIYFLNYGRYYGTFRYMGTFNDPNQFGYYIFISFCFIYLLTIKNKKQSLIYFIISFFLILESSSTGMLLGMLAFIVLYLFNFIVSFGNHFKENIKKIITMSLFSVLILLIVSSVLIVNPSLNINIYDRISNLQIINRVNDKIRRSQESSYSGTLNLWQERGYDKIYLYPQYILYGSGEGEYERFSLAAHNDEIHATFPSMLFYYGIFPFYFLLAWIYKKIRKLPLKALIIYLTILAESFTLLNQRQVLFWLFIMILSLFGQYKFNENAS